MRVNVYAEEIITDAIEIVRKSVVPNGTSYSETFYGVRIKLESSDKLHHNTDDDDSSAITFWVKWTRDRGNNVFPLAQVFSRVVIALQEIQDEIIDTNMRATRIKTNREYGTENTDAHTVDC